MHYKLDNPDKFTELFSDAGFADYEKEEPDELEDEEEPSEVIKDLHFPEAIKDLHFPEVTEELPSANSLAGEQWEDIEDDE